jgi:hypothetical protein
MPARGCRTEINERSKSIRGLTTQKHMRSRMLYFSWKFSYLITFKFKCSMSNNIYKFQPSDPGPSTEPRRAPGDHHIVTGSVLLKPPRVPSPTPTFSLFVMSRDFPLPPQVTGPGAAGVSVRVPGRESRSPNLISIKFFESETISSRTVAFGSICRGQERHQIF